MIPDPTKARETVTLNVIIADDHPIYRAGLKTTLTTVFEDVDVRETGHMDGLRKHLKSRCSDLLLLDIFFPGLEPEDGIAALRREHPLMAILIVSMLIDNGAVERILRAGANGFVSKTISPDHLEKGLREVMAGERPVYLPVPRRGRPMSASDNPIADLPRRQMEVLRLICMGLSNKEIARDLGLSISTIRAHVSALFRKLAVANRAAAASYGALYGVLGSPIDTDDGGA